ncbi:Uncharacterised protein [Clostridium perfringens]|nr:hypothetical protein [Clostridium perfringens]SQB35279.1 Uncharacterised protein [Clostridium perfringens]HAT4314145.1 hypothetical protein [Clostridium perfringens]
MRFIIGDKVFDTNKAEVVCKFKTIKHFGGRWIEETLYKTKKNNWFIVDEDSKCSSITESRARVLLRELNNVELYEKYFGKLEEA